MSAALVCGALASLLAGAAAFLPASGARQSIYVTGNERSIWSLEAASGSIEWNYTAPCEIDLSVGAPVLSLDRTSLFISCHQMVLALSAADGRLLWQYSDSSLMLDAAPAVDSSTVYVNSFNRDILALSLERGELLWTGQLPSGTGEGLSPQLSSDQKALFFANSGLEAIYAVNKSNGKVLRSVDLLSYVNAFVFSLGCVVGDTLFVGDFNNLSAVDVVDGSLQWRVGLDNGLYSQTGASAVAVSTDGGALYSAGYGSVHAVSVETGEVIWSFRYGGDLGTQPNGVAVSRDNSMVFTSVTVPPMVLALSAADGTIRWSANLSAAYVPQPPVPSDDGALLLVGDDAGPLHAIDAKSGAIKWTFFG